MKRFFSIMLSLAVILQLFGVFPADMPVRASAQTTAVEQNLTWHTGTWYDKDINPTLKTRKWTVLACEEGDVIHFNFASSSWGIYVYFADENGALGSSAYKQYASTSTLTVQKIDGRSPTYLRITVYPRPQNDVEITEQMWSQFDITCTKESEQTQTNSITVATMNYGRWNNGGTVAGAASSAVGSLGSSWNHLVMEKRLDILCGQEWEEYFDQAKTIKANDYVFAGLYGENQYSSKTNINYMDKHIAAKTKLEDTQEHVFANSTSRNYIKTYVQINGKRICVINTHHSFDPDFNLLRKGEFCELLTVMAQEEYVIVMGDFNVYTIDEFKLFTDAGYSIANCGEFGEFKTWTIDRGDEQCLDNIIVSPSIRIKNVTMDDRDLSDHAMLLAELELLDEGDYTDTRRTLCEHCGEQVVWKPWTLTNGSTANAIQEDAHYYLTGDVTGISSMFRIGVNGSATPDVVIDLRGHSITAASVRAFYLRSSSKLSIVDSLGGGKVKGGAKDTGGAIYLEKNSEFILHGGDVYGTDTTTAKKGGVIYAETGAKVTVKGGALHGGYASHGGAIYVANGNTVQLEGGTVYGSEVTTAGGAIYSGSSILRLNGATISGGTAPNGGGIYAIYTKLELTGGTITGGQSTDYGGNVHIGEAGSAGYTNLGNCTITGGTASNGGKDIYVSSAGKLKVLSTFKGSSSVAVSSTHLPADAIGGTLSATYETCEGPFPGQLYLENLTGKPRLYGKSGDTKLYIEGAVLVKEDGFKVWYANNEAAVTAYATEENVAYLQPFADTLVLAGKNYTVDLAGQTVSITGTGTLTCFDSANAGHVYAGGCATVGEDVKLLNTGLYTAPDQNDYVKLTAEDGSCSFHHVAVQIKSVSLKTGAAGIYYTGQWKCDTTLAKNVEQYGVVVSLADTQTLPDLSVEADHCFYTQLLETANGTNAFTAADFDGTVEGTGVLISGIMKDTKDAEDNAAHGIMPIRAVSYLKLKDGTTLYSGEEAYSLYAMMVTLDALITSDPDTYGKYADALDAFYAQWKNKGMDEWKFENIGQ